MSTASASASTAQSAQQAAMIAAHSGTREYLSFKLGAEEYGIDILKVQEIRGYEPPTRIANVPDFSQAPEFNSAVEATFITGLGTVKTGDTMRMLILMNIEDLMKSPDMGLMDLAAH